MNYGLTILTAHHGKIIVVCKGCHAIPKYCDCKNCKCREKQKDEKVGHQ